MITVEGLSKSFGTVKAVDQVSFEVKQGEIVGLLGPNGAGKTTTLRLIAGYLRPQSGSVKVSELDAIEDTQRVRRLIGYLPEYNPLYQDLLVYDYLQYIADLRELPGDQREARIKDIVTVCGLTEAVDKKIGELSKGNRQRVGLAQAMLHDPEVLILDEPTAGLDPNQISEIRDLIKRLGREKTVIISSHILSEVEATCDRVIIIHQGKVVANGKLAELQRTSGSDYHLQLKLGQTKGKAVLPLLKKLKGVSFAEAAADESKEIKGFTVAGSHEHDLRPAIFQWAQDEGFVLYEMHREVVSLEDVFRRLTTN